MKGRPLKILDDSIGENLISLKFGNNFIEKPMEEITDKLDSIKIKISALWKTISIEWEDKSQTGRKYVQEIYIIKDCYPKYTKKFKTQN